MLSVTYKSFMLSAAILNVVMLIVAMLYVIVLSAVMLSVVAPLLTHFNAYSDTCFIHVKISLIPANVRLRW
jgi:hypothetical protein